MVEFFDIDGAPLTMMEWSAKSARKRTEDYGRVGSDELNLDGVELWVSTVWIGLDMGLGSIFWPEDDWQPIIYETAIFAPGGNVEVIKRYATWAEAEEGHQHVVTVLRNGRLRELSAFRELEA